MKRFITAIICFALFATLAVVCVEAHPGRTDSNGGHYNHSTGEYHYHHGQPEHYHYDIDGDGDLDCPYEYEHEEGLKGGIPITKSESEKDGTKWWDTVPKNKQEIIVLCVALVVLFLLFGLPWLIDLFRSSYGRK